MAQARTAAAGTHARIARRLRAVPGVAVMAADDPQTAAEHFNWLAMSSTVNRVMLCGDTELPDRTSLSHYADAGTRAFLAAYGPR